MAPSTRTIDYLSRNMTEERARVIATAGAGASNKALDAASDNAAVAPSEEFYRATSLLSIWGPCRRVGDEYLSCVVTAGMGMCKPLRRHFEQCATETSDHATEMLDQLGLQACSYIDGEKDHKSEADRTIAKRNCAAEILLRSQSQGPMQ